MEISGYFVYQSYKYCQLIIWWYFGIFFCTWHKWAYLSNYTTQAMVYLLSEYFQNIWQWWKSHKGSINTTWTELNTLSHGTSCVI